MRAAGTPCPETSAEDADSVLIDGNEFIEVPGDGRHRTIRSVDVKSVDLWNAAGETTLR
jgi:hypothetical protein